MFNRNLKSAALWGVLAMVMVFGSLLMGGCTKEKAKTSAEIAVFKFAGPWAPTTLDTAIEAYHYTRLGICETLVGIDYDCKPSPMLAKSWKVSDDGLTWTFQLRDDVKFHDGTALTAEMAKNSLERTFKKAVSFKTLPLKEIKVSDKYTLVIATTKPFAPLIGYLASDASAIVAPASLNENDEMVKPVGTGPFKFDSWVSKESITAVKFDDYWGTKPKIEKVVYLAVPEGKTRETMLRAGEADLAWLLSPDVGQALKKDPAFTVITQTRVGRVNQLMLNTKKSPLDDVNVRNAIKIAINRDLICKSLMEGLVQPAAGPLPSGHPWANQNIKPFAYDLEKAKSLLEEAGWSDSDGDGVREKGGKKLEVGLFTYSTRPDLPPIAEALKDQLGKLGIKVTINILDSAAITAQAKAGKVDIYLISRSILWNNDPDSWAADFLADSTYQNYMNFAPADVVSLINNGRETMDNAERKKIYDELQERVLKDAPVVYITYYTNVAAVKSDVKGYREHPTEFCYHLENVYKEKK
jgi:peptide/nickel transport system substrate-binding protein